MKFNTVLFLTGLLVISMAKAQPDVHDHAGSNGGFASIIPVPKEFHYEEGFFSFHDTLSFFAGSKELEPLYGVLKKEFKSLYLTEIVAASGSENADVIIEAGLFQGDTLVGSVWRQLFIKLKND